MQQPIFKRIQIYAKVQLLPMIPKGVLDDKNKE